MKRQLDDENTLIELLKSEVANYKKYSLEILFIFIQLIIGLQGDRRDEQYCPSERWCCARTAGSSSCLSFS